MDAPCDAVAAALACVDDADARHDAAAIIRELAALPGSELVVARCCEALTKNENARAAAASADALFLVLEALRRHASCVAVVEAAWCALNLLLKNGESLLMEAAVEHGAMELALTSVCDTTAVVETVEASLAAFCFVATPHYVSRALQLGGVEVRCLVCNTARPKSIAHQGCGASDVTFSRKPTHK